jgi:hypothetical protein
MSKKTILILPLLLTLSHTTPRPLLQFGFESGVTIDHDFDADYTIDAGDGFRFELGMAIDDPQNEMELQFLAGYKFDSNSADNGSISWSMIPISALGFIKIPSWKFGGGLTYHLNPELDGSFGREDIKDEFKNALGGVIQIQYEPMDMFALGLRATFIDYKLKADSTQTASGNSIGFIGTFKFGGKRSRFR